MYELTCQQASFEPPSEEEAQLFAAIAESPQASDEFATMLAGLMPVQEFFDPARIERALGPLELRASSRA